MVKLSTAIKKIHTHFELPYIYTVYIPELFINGCCFFFFLH